MGEKFNIREYLSINEKIRISLSSSRKTLHAETDILEIIDNQTILVCNPKIDGLHYEPVKNKEFQAEVEKKNAVVCRFTVMFLDESLIKQKRYFKMKCFEDFKLIHLRSYFRLEIFSEVYVYVSSLSQNLEKQKAELVDISGGGLGIISEDVFKIDEKVTCNFDLEGESFDIKGSIRTIKKDAYSSSKKNIGIMFDELDIKGEKRLLSVINKMQRKLIKKG